MQCNAILHELRPKRLREWVCRKDREVTEGEVQPILRTSASLSAAANLSKDSVDAKEADLGGQGWLV